MLVWGHLSLNHSFLLYFLFCFLLASGAFGLDYHVKNTEANSTALDSEEAEWKRRGGRGGSDSRLGTANSDMATANTGKVKFDPPSVPVIFVLGIYQMDICSGYYYS